jgi:Zn-finger nucleic acid-binding protein
MTDRQGVEIDYCPQCRGVWLDRGELDKIIERSNVEPERSNRDDYRSDSHPQQRYRDEHSGHYDRHHPKRKRSMLSELFDFD